MYRYVPYSFMFLSVSFCLNVFTNVWLYYHCILYYTILYYMYVSWSEFLCFSEGFCYCSAITTVTDCSCIGTSVDPCLSLSLSFSFCVCQCPGILSVICMYVNKCNQLNPRLRFIYFIFCVYTYVSWFVFLSLPLSLNVCTSLRLYYYSV